MFWFFRDKPDFKKYDWRYIIIHHSATKDGSTVDWAAIRRYHLGLGWNYIGYHFGIEKINNEYEILMGRPLNQNGAHTQGQGMNSKAIGICCVGNYDIDVPDDNMLKSLAVLVKSLQTYFNIPNENIRRHQDFDNKTCPGLKFDIKNFVDDFLSKI